MHACIESRIIGCTGWATAPVTQCPSMFSGGRQRVFKSVRDYFARIGARAVALVAMHVRSTAAVLTLCAG